MGFPSFMNFVKFLYNEGLMESGSSFCSLQCKLYNVNITWWEFQKLFSAFLTLSNLVALKDYTCWTSRKLLYYSLCQTSLCLIENFLDCSFVGLGYWGVFWGQIFVAVIAFSKSLFDLIMYVSGSASPTQSCFQCFLPASCGPNIQHINIFPINFNCFTI